MAEQDHQFGGELCRILGLDAERVKSISIDANAGHVPLVTVVFYTTDEQRKSVTELVWKYRLVRRDDGE